MNRRSLKNNKKSTISNKFALPSKLKSIKGNFKKQRSSGRIKSKDKSQDKKTKKLSKSVKKNKFKIPIIFALLLLLTLLTVGFIYKDNLSNMNLHSFSKAQGDDIKTLELKENNFRMLFLVLDKVDDDRSFINELYISQVDYDNNSLKLVALPEIARITPSDGGSAVPIRNLYNLGAQNDPRKDISYAVSEIENYFGIRIDRYFIFTNNGNGSDYDLVRIPEGDTNINQDLNTRTERFVDYLKLKLKEEQGFFSFVKEYNTSQGIKSNLSSDEAKKFVDLVRQNDLKTSFDIFGEQELEEKTDEFGNFEIINKELSDEKIRNYFESVDIKKEQARIEVYNASGARLLGNKWSRVFKNSSLDVTRVGTAKEADTTKIYASSPNMVYNLNRVKSVLKLDIEVVENEKPEFVTTGDIIVVIGKDILNN